MNNTGNFPRFFIYFFVLVFVLFSGYKYFEYITIKGFVDFQNEAEKKEYRLTEKMDQLSEKTTPLINSFYGIRESNVATKSKKSDEKLFEENYALLEEIINLNRVDMDLSKEYNDLIKNNLQNYIKYNKKLTLILSQNSRLLRQYIDSQFIYYKNEIQTSDSNLVDGAFVENYFKILQDRLGLNYLSKTFDGRSKTYYSENYDKFSVLEKYTRSDFHFLNEESIKINRPYGYEWLDKSKKYFAAYYELIKEYTYGDEDSYNYKFEKYKTLIADFNIDMNKLFDENSSDKQEKARDILKTVFDRFLIANKLKQNNFNIFPVFGKTNSVDADLVMCQSYPYRFSLYKSITDKYPSGKNIDDILKEFDEVNLANKEADALFDKNLLVYSESEYKANFECKDPAGNQNFKFVINK